MSFLYRQIRFYVTICQSQINISIHLWLLITSLFFSLPFQLKTTVIIMKYSCHVYNLACVATLSIKWRYSFHNDVSISYQLPSLVTGTNAVTDIIDITFVSLLQKIFSLSKCSIKNADIYLIDLQQKMRLVLKKGLRKYKMLTCLMLKRREKSLRTRGQQNKKVNLKRFDKTRTEPMRDKKSLWEEKG